MRFIGSSALGRVVRGERRRRSRSPARRAPTGNTSSTWSKRLIAKISATTGCSAATAMRAPSRAHLLRRDHQHAQAHAADVVDAGEIEHETADIGTRPQRCERGFERRRPGKVGATGGRNDDDVSERAAGYVQGRRSVWRAGGAIIRPAGVHGLTGWLLTRLRRSRVLPPLRAGCIDR